MNLIDCAVREWPDNTAAVTVTGGTVVLANANALSGTSGGPQTRVGDVYGGAALTNGSAGTWNAACPCQGTEGIQFAVVGNGVTDPLAPRFDHGSLTYTSLEKLTKDNLEIGSTYDGSMIDPRTGASFLSV